MGLTFQFRPCTAFKVDCSVHHCQSNLSVVRVFNFLISSTHFVLRLGLTLRQSSLYYAYLVNMGLSDR